MPTRLSIYNGALRLCGERKLASLTENRPPRHLLDDVWNDDGVKSCLEQAQWRFATRAQRIDFDPDYAAEFGYRYRYAKPDDWVKTVAVSPDEFFRNALTDFNDEAGYWYSDITPVYFRFVSNDTSYGMDMSLWPAKFTEYVEAYFAGKIIMSLSGGESKAQALLKPNGGLIAIALADAKSKDAFDGEPRQPQRGSWVTARAGRTSNDRGRNGQLIG